jgi:hypothetical protein
MVEAQAKGVDRSEELDPFDGVFKIDGVEKFTDGDGSGFHDG